MDLTLRHHFVFWSLAFAGLLGFVFVFKGVLLPFILGIAVAYLLNPLVNALGRLKIARAPAALMILGGFFLLLAIVIAAVSPVVYRQFLELAEDMPGYIDRVIVLMEPVSAKVLALVGEDGTTDLKGLLQAHAGSAFDLLKQVAGSLAAGGQAALDMISVIVFMPIVAYYVMKEWVRISTWVQGMLPMDNKVTILDLLKKIDAKLSGFVRGQISVAVLLGIAYAVVLTILGLKYGFLIGLSAGLLSIIPMVGSTIGLLVSIAVAWFQSGDLMFVALIGGVFVAGQIIEGNILTPKLVGDSVGLHPLWVFFALLAGGSLFGILGMLIAVPVAAVAGVLLSFAISQYKASVYFLGQKKPKKAPKKARKTSSKKKVTSNA